MSHPRRAFTLAASLLVSTTAIAQTTLQVPSAFPSIQAAIVAAANGDTVLVAPGVFVENVNFLGKAITVRSSVGPSVTTIDGNQAGSVVTFASNETRSSVLDGFTIRNGRGPIAAPRGGAGGIQCTSASPTIRRCIVTANFGGDGLAAAPTGGPGGPGGVLATGTGLQLIDCEVTANVGGNGGVATGGGSFLTGGAGGPGGAFFSFDALGAGTPDVQRCRFTGNSGGDGGNATSTSGNSASAGAGGAGGVGSFSLVPLTLFVYLRIDGNTGGDGGVATTTGFTTPGRGGNGGFDFANPPALSLNYLGLLSSSVVGNIAGNGGTGTNSAGGHGGGSTGALRFHSVSSTIAGNAGGNPQLRGQVSGGVAGGFSMVSSTTISSSILWGNTVNGVASDLNSGGIPANGTASNVGAVTGVLLGNGNISIDPLFVNLAAGDVHLTAASPCRHTGISGLGATGFDYEGDPRVVGPASDMGADEFDVLTGSREDFALSLSVNSVFDPSVATSNGNAGDLVDISLTTPTGTFGTDVTWLAFEVWVPPAAPVGPPGLPELQIGAINLFAVYSSGIGATGTNLVFAVPPGLGGLAARFQSFCISPLAKNGLFAATAARDLVF